MENLKIKVNSEAESKEAQELFFELGYKWLSGGNQAQHLKQSCSSSFGYLVAWSSGCFTDVIQCGCGNEDAKEITLPELRDLVVLKRNDPNDGTHIDRYNKPWYVTSDNLFYCFEYGREWVKENQRVFDSYEVKPIEKPMKEYLIKSGDGKYLLTHHDSIGAIEIPEGATAARLCNDVEFYKNDFDMFFSRTSGNWLNTISPRGILMKNIVWQRAQHPEELPFIDDEPKPSLNDQYAEIEKVRQSHRTASVIADSALKHIRERAETYDQPTGERSAAKTAKAFNAITGKDITESEVWLLLQLLKDVRQWSREDYHQDSAEDCIAYAALKAESLEGGE